jgi:parallel beta-helix repeat protein
MNKSWVKKASVFVMVILFVGVYNVPSLLSAETSKNTPVILTQKIWIVDDEGDGDFTTIQQAIDDINVLDGDTIMVFSGMYENIVVHKSLAIIGVAHEYENGSDTGKPIINGGAKNAIDITEIEEVCISGFIIRDSGEHGVFLKEVSGAIISKNNITNNFFHGIFAEDVSNIQILNNYIIDNKKIGITLQSFDVNNIYTYNYILGNHIGNNGEQGILVTYTNHNVISGNNIEDNGLHGICIWYAHRNNILYNNFINNNNENNQPLLILWNSHLTIWRGNFWDRPLMRPKLIVGSISVGPLSVPWVNYDWQPAKEPHIIPYFMEA